MVRVELLWILASWFLIFIFPCYILSNAFPFNYVLCSAPDTRYNRLNLSICYCFLKIGIWSAISFLLCSRFNGDKIGSNGFWMGRGGEMMVIIDVVVWFSIAVLFQHFLISNKTLLNNLFVAAFHSFSHKTQDTENIEHWILNRKQCAVWIGKCKEAQNEIIYLITE